jgi:hypothetical protein
MRTSGIRTTSGPMHASITEEVCIMRPTAFFALVLIAALTTPAFAQAPPAGRPTPVRGTVEKLADRTLTVKTPDGGSVPVALAPDFTVRSVVAKTLADIKPGDKVAITSVKGSNGARRAIEIHMLPANMPASRLREEPWDRGPDSLMTNAIVAQISSAAQGQMIKVTLNGKESEIAVPPDTPIVGYGPGDASLLKPGAAVFIFARKQPDGSLTAAGVTAEKNGVKPPM